MHHQPRRRGARVATVLLGLVLAAVLVARAAPSGRVAEAQTATGAPAATAPLDQDVAPVFTALNAERTAAGHATLQLDDRLATSAARDACAIARGDLPLSGDPDRLADAGAHRENTGMVIEGDPILAARAMHRWWAATRRHRNDRMDPAMTRYGVGACNDEDRTYYVERLAR